MYSIADYKWMMEDSVRVKAYLAALEKIVKPNDVVVDLGAGIGTWAFMCCRLGARKAYAIETSPAVHVGKRIAAANGLVDRVEFIQELSTAVVLPEKADVIVFALNGQQPIFENSLTSVIDARERFLQKGGTLVPFRDSLWGCVIEDHATYAHFVDFWNSSFYGIDMRPAKPFATDWRYGARFTPAQMLTKKVLYAVLDYRTLRDPEVQADFKLTVERAGTGHALYLWFDSELYPSIGFSNAPGEPDTVCGGTFLAWPEPAELEVGDEVRVSLSFRLVNSEYVWAWETRILRGDQILAQYSQSTFKHYLPKLPAFGSIKA